MDFFQRQRLARRSSARLLLLFALAVLLNAAAMAWPLCWLAGQPLSVGLWLWAGLVLVMMAGSVWRIGELRQGGGALARSLGAVGVPLASDDPALRRLRNVTEEMAVAAGIPVPRLYVLAEERAINAFAAGHGEADAAVVVTQGALRRLGRDELQAMVAHELAHVLNGDMRLNLQLMGLLHGLLVPCLLVYALAGWMVGQAKREGDIRLALLALLLVPLLGLTWVLGSSGRLLARLIKAAHSRQRELLADAGAVQFTRQTRGLAGALKKIGACPEGAVLQNRELAEQVSHMLFGEGWEGSRWFATHPPLVARIAELEPAFSGVQLKVLRRRWLQQPPEGLSEDRQPAPTVAAATPASGAPVPVSPAQVCGHIGNPGEDDWRQAQRLLAMLPASLLANARDAQAAPALLLALVLDARAMVALRQRALVAKLDAPLEAQMQGLAERVQRLHPGLRLPLAELAFPALRSLPRPRLRLLCELLDALVHVSGQVELADYCLAQLVRRLVLQTLDPAVHVRFGRRTLPAAVPALAQLLGVFARAGHPGDEPAARRAWAAAWQQLPVARIPDWPMASEPVQVLDAAWEPLDGMDPLIKPLVVQALVACAASDGRIRVAEAELLRLVCGVLRCPLPALLAGERD